MILLYHAIWRSCYTEVYDDLFILCINDSAVYIYLNVVQLKSSAPLPLQGALHY